MRNFPYLYRHLKNFGQTFRETIFKFLRSPHPSDPASQQPQFLLCNEFLDRLEKWFWQLGECWNFSVWRENHYVHSNNAHISLLSPFEVRSLDLFWLHVVNDNFLMLPSPLKAFPWRLILFVVFGNAWLLAIYSFFRMLVMIRGGGEEFFFSTQ